MRQIIENYRYETQERRPHADEGIDAKQYQQLLVLKAVGTRLQPFANTLGRGSLKERIMMMYQKKSNRWKMLKALLVIPTTGFALYAFATPEVLPEMQAVLEKEVSVSIIEATITTPTPSEQPEEDEVLSRLLEEKSFNLDGDESLDENQFEYPNSNDDLIIDDDASADDYSKIDSTHVTSSESKAQNTGLDIVDKHAT